MNQPTSTSTDTAPLDTHPGVVVGQVYVLTEHLHEGDTVLYITTSLDDAQNYHANHPVRTQVQPWQPIVLRSELDDEPTTWITRPISGGYGAVYYIHKTPLHSLLSAAAETGHSSSADGTTASEAAAGERYDRLRDGLLALIPTTDPELIDAGYAIPAADILPLLGADTGAQDDPALATMSDAEAFREACYPESTISDSDLLALLNRNSDILATAREYGWAHTDVRDLIADILDATADDTTD
jgi:hypothetical protein